MNDIKQSFPKSEIEALAYLYCEKHITEDTSIEELAKLYKETCKLLTKEFSSNWEF